METPPGFDFDAFISYRRIDGTGAARWLRASLGSYRLPAALGEGRTPLKTYLDTAFERASEDFWASNIEPALRRSRFLIVVVTPSVFEPRADGAPGWVEREIELFLSLPHGRKNILMVTAGGNPISRLPEALQGTHPRIGVVDLSGVEQWWNVARRTTMRDRMLTLVASIYGIADTDMPLLRQEEERRKRLRALRFASVSTVLVIVFAALLVIALVQWKQAATERTAAQAKSLGLASLQDFDAGRQIQALLEAVEGARMLQQLVPAPASFDAYPTTMPVLALNRALQGIRERNRREHEQDSMKLQGQATTATTAGCSLPAGLSDDGIKDFMGHEGALMAKGCTPDGRYLVTTATDNTVRLADLSGPRAPQLIGLQGGARFLSFAADSKRFTTTDVWGTVVDWDISGAGNGLRSSLEGHTSTVTAIGFSGDSASVATGSRDGQIRTWSVDGRPLGNPVTGKGQVLAVWLDQGARRVLALDSTGGVSDWQQGNPTSPANFGSSINGIFGTIGNDGQHIGITIAGGDARFYDLKSGTSASVRGTHSGWIMGIAFPPRADVVATAGADDTVGLHRPTGEAFGPSIRAAQGQVMSVAFSPDGSTIASAGEDGTVKLWNLSGAQTGQLIGHNGKVLDVRFSPDGHLIATSGADGTVRLWVRDGEQVSQWPGQTGFLATEISGGSFGAVGLSFSPDSRKIAIADSSHAVRIYRIQSLDELLASACAWLAPYIADHPDAARVCAKGS
jgi:WD40 repeat protein